MKTVTAIIILICSQSVCAKNLLSSIHSIDVKTLESSERTALIARINHDLLESKAKEFDIELPSGIKSTVVFDRFKQHKKGRFSWFGHLKGQPQEQIHISHVNGHYSGALYTKHSAYEFSSPTEGQIKIIELNPNEAFHCDANNNQIISKPKSHAPTEKLLNKPLKKPLSNPKHKQSNQPTQIDVMVVYTDRTVQFGGGVSGVEARAQASVDAMTLAFSNSNVDAEVNLVYTGLVDYSEGPSALNWVSSDSNVAALRNTYAADMVAIFVELNGVTGCGTAWGMNDGSAGPQFAPLAFQATKRNCALRFFTLAHEFGHNMGLRHNPEDSTPEFASFPWSFGHYQHNNFRTIMSYAEPCEGANQGCPRQPYYSNPDVQFNNQDTGVDGERDNARTLRATIDIVAAFRDPLPDLIFENGFESN